MDYKYIEQLMDRYWECETSLEEEQILRTFFSQEMTKPGIYLAFAPALSRMMASTSILNSWPSVSINAHFCNLTAKLALSFDFT